MSVYPQRNSHFAHKFTRLLFDSGATAEIGLEGVALCVHIAHIEDARHYSGAVREWNSQLCRTLGVSDNRLRKIRDKCVSAGWLHYDRGNTREIGVYWCLVPVSLSDERAQVDPQADVNQLVSAQITSNSEGNTRGNPGGNTEGNSGGVSVGDANGPSLPSPNPIPNPSSSCPGNSPDEDKAPKYRFDSRDMDCASWMWKLVQDVQPRRRHPNLESWANTIRLMRERDRRTYQEIADLFTWVNKDTFWQTNCMSPETLRERWDDLSLKCERASPDASRPARRDFLEGQILSGAELEAELAKDGSDDGR